MTQESENSLREPDFGQTTSGATPDVVDGVAIAKLYGEPLFKVPDGLYIPPDALEVFLESFEGPLDLLLYLIRKQKFDVMNVPMALVTEQYMGYVELIRKSNLELAAEYLVMAACLMQIKSRLLLPVTRADDDEEVEDPQAELARRLLEYEKIKLAAVELDRIPRNGRDFWRAFVLIEQTQNKILPDVSSEELARGWQEVLAGYVRRLELSMDSKLEMPRQRLTEKAARLAYLSPENQIREKRMYLLRAEEKLTERMEKKLQMEKTRLYLYVERLRGVSPLEKLQQGLGYMEHDDGTRISSVNQVTVGDLVECRKNRAFGGVECQ